MKQMFSYEVKFFLCCTKVRLCNEGVTKLFLKGFDIAFFYIRMVKANLHPNCIRVHSILNPLELFSTFKKKKNLTFDHFFQTIGLFELVNLVLKSL